MDIKHNILLTILFFSVLNINYCFSQVKAYNDKGEKILVYPDGSWIYDKEDEAPEKGKKPKKAGKAKVEQTEPIYTRQEMIAARNEVTGKYKKAREEKEAASEKKDIASYELATYLQRKEQEHLEMPMNDVEKYTYKSRVKIMKRAVKDAKKKMKAASKREKRYRKILTYNGDKLMVSYKKLLAKEGALNEGVATADSKQNKKKRSDDPLEEAKKDYERQIEEIKKRKEEEMEQKLATAKLRSDKLLGYRNQWTVTVAEGCEMAFDEMDPFTGKRKRATKSRELFSFVNEGYESVLKGKGYLVCEGFISEINNGKDYLLVLDFIVNSMTGKEEFGGLKKGGDISIMLIDGSRVVLKSTEADKGTVDVGKGRTTFRGFYPLEKTQLKTLAAKEVSKIVVVWVNGFEDYEVYEMDFFRNQIDCLRKTK